MLCDSGASDKLEHDCPHSRINLKENEHHLHHHKRLVKRMWNFEGGFKHNIQQAEEDHIFKKNCSGNFRYHLLFTLKEIIENTDPVK